MWEQKPKPLRMCLGCNQRDAQESMLRVAIADGTPVVDSERCLPGRGGYLHREAACLEKFTRSKVREFRSLRRALTVNERQLLVDSIGSAAGHLKTAGIR